MNLKQRIENAFNNQEPVCLSCGWVACFHELGPWYETSAKNEYSAACVNKDYECSGLVSVLIDDEERNENQ